MRVPHVQAAWCRTTRERAACSAQAKRRGGTPEEIVFGNRSLLVASPSDYGTLPRPTTRLAPIHGSIGGGSSTSGSGTAPPQESQGMCDGHTRLHRRHIAHAVAHNQVVSLPVHARDELDPAGRVEDEALWLGLGLG